MSTFYFENEKHYYSFDLSDTLFTDKDNETVVIMSRSVETEKLDKSAKIFPSLESVLQDIVNKEAEKRTKEALSEKVENVSNSGFGFSAFAENRLVNAYTGKIKQDAKSAITYYLTINRKIAKVNFLAVDENEKELFGDCENKRKVTELNEKLYNLICHVAGAVSGKEFEKLLREFYGGNSGYTVNGDRMHVLKGAFKMVHTCKMKTVDGEEKLSEKIQFMNKPAQKAEFCSVLFANDDVIKTIRNEKKK